MNLEKVTMEIFLSVISLLAKYDHVLEKLLAMLQGSVRYLSTTIQNEMIILLAGHFKKTLPVIFNLHHTSQL